jgi:hypothetical protein
MDRKTLERNGIYFEEKVNETKIELLPAHVRSLRNAALDFDFTILDRLSCDTDGDLDLLEEEGNDDIKILAERDMLFDTLRACSEAIEEARRLTAGADREREWVEHYVNWFLDPLYKASQVRDEDSRVYVFPQYRKC